MTSALPSFITHDDGKGARCIQSDAFWPVKCCCCPDADCTPRTTSAASDRRHCATCQVQAAERMVISVRLVFVGEADEGGEETGRVKSLCLLLFSWTYNNGEAPRGINGDAMWIIKLCCCPGAVNEPRRRASDSGNCAGRHYQAAYFVVYRIRLGG